MQRLKFYGLGGQGVVTAAKVLSTAVSIYDGKNAITIPAYGHERRGAPVYTDVMVDEVPIKVNCYVYEPDIVLVMDDILPEKGVNVGEGKHEDTILVLNASSRAIAEHYAETYGFKEVWYVNATQVALDTIGRGIPNAAMLGALAHTSVSTIESVEIALKEFFGVKAGEINAKAARNAYEQTVKL